MAQSQEFDFGTAASVADVASVTGRDGDHHLAAVATGGGAFAVALCGEPVAHLGLTEGNEGQDTHAGCVKALDRSFPEGAPDTMPVAGGILGRAARAERRAEKAAERGSADRGSDPAPSTSARPASAVTGG